MEKLVSSWSNGEMLPESYIFPPGIRPGDRVVPIDANIPVIDLSKSEGDYYHKDIVHQIIEASNELGFFQVINHGVSTRLMDDTRRIFNEFFELPSEEKSRFLSTDFSKEFMLFTSNVDYDREEIHNWRDTIRHKCSPLEEYTQHWPQKPTKYREVVGEYTVKVRDLGYRILELICEGLQLESGHFTKELSQGQVMTVHKYPPCPDPRLTLGTRKHCDPGLLTILLQGDVPGLQVLRNGLWTGIEAIPDAFLVNVGYQLQIVSNGKLRSIEHRAVTNEEKTRISAAFFIAPSNDCLVEPARAIVDSQNPAIYKGFKYGDFLKTFRAAYVGEINDVLKPYMIEA